MMKEIINYTLAFFMWLVIGRAILNFLLNTIFAVPDPMKNPVYVFFYRSTQWLYNIFKFLPCCKTLLIIIFIFVLRLVAIKYL